MKVLKNNFKDVMDLLENADNYCLQKYSQDLLIIEAKLREFDSTDSESESDSKEDETDNRRVEVLCTRDQPYPLYDKTIRHIEGLSYGSLSQYKNYFLETVNVKMPEKFIENETLVKRLTDFLYNDE